MIRLVLTMTLFQLASFTLADDRVFEMRTYHTMEGKLDELHARFRNPTVQLFEKHGMTNVGYWVPTENAEEKLIYLMAYPSREARDAMWKAFRNDPDWKKAYATSTANGKLVKKVESVFLETVDYSPELKIEKADPTRLFELRIYTTNEGKLDNLNARFRDHTVALFEKHGMENLVYFVPQAGQEASGHTLVYLIAHQDEDTRSNGFKSFSQDPAWQSARKESEKDGKILVKKGVKSILLDPVDYSPMR